MASPLLFSKSFALVMRDYRPGCEVVCHKFQSPAHCEQIFSSKPGKVRKYLQIYGVTYLGSPTARGSSQLARRRRREREFPVDQRAAVF